MAGSVSHRCLSNRGDIGLSVVKCFTVAWRSVPLPARCFTSTVSFGWHHLTPVSLDNLNAAHDVARRSSSAKNQVRSSPASGGRRLLIQNKRGGPSVNPLLGIIRKASRDAAYYATLAQDSRRARGQPWRSSLNPLIRWTSISGANHERSRCDEDARSEDRCTQ